MTTTARDHNRISLIFRGRYEEYPNHGSTLKPGMLAYVDFAGRVRPHAEPGAGGECIIVDMDLKRGGTVDDTYDAAQDQDVIPCLIPLEGDVLAVLVKANQTTEIGKQLASNGDGTFINGDINKYSMFVALEAATDTSDFLVKARRISTHNKTDESS